MNPDYLSYSASDFAADEYFQQWFLQPDGETQSFWLNFLEAHPEKSSAVLEAKAMLRHLQEDADAPPAGRKALVWERIQDQLAEEREPVPIRKGKVVPVWQKWAASVAAILLLAAGYLYLYNPSGSPQYATGKNEKRIVALPDGSEVLLNENSSLKLAEAWNRRQSREVWLQGEAYFKVRKKPGFGDATFIVHTKDLNVEVLGTSFNVKTRGKATQVVLSEGKVKINPADPAAAGAVYMAPGEAVTLGESRTITKKAVKPELYTAWKTDELVLNKTSLREIGLFIGENYGLTVSYQNDTLPDLILDGTALPTGNRDSFLRAVTTTLGIRADIQQNQLIFKP